MRAAMRAAMNAAMTAAMFTVQILSLGSLRYWR